MRYVNISRFARQFLSGPLCNGATCLERLFNQRPIYTNTSIRDSAYTCMHARRTQLLVRQKLSRIYRTIILSAGGSGDETFDRENEGSASTHAYTRTHTYIYKRKLSRAGRKRTKRRIKAARVRCSFIGKNSPARLTRNTPSPIPSLRLPALVSRALNQSSLTFCGPPYGFCCFFIFTASSAPHAFLRFCRVL